LCGSENKQRLFPYTALTDWFLWPRRSVFTARYGLIPYIKQIASRLQEVKLLKRNLRLHVKFIPMFVTVLLSPINHERRHFSVHFIPIPDFKFSPKAVVPTLFDRTSCYVCMSASI
jgi:hypothetical protein